MRTAQGKGNQKECATPHASPLDFPQKILILVEGESKIRNYVYPAEFLYERMELTTARSGRRQGVTSQKLVSA
jgi:hypothetical protein